MKRIFTTIILFFLTHFILHAQSGWFWQNPLPQGAGLKAVHFTDTLTGYAVGSTGKVLKTYNGGTDWTILYSGTTEHLNDLFFTDNATAYTVGNNGTILKTTNSGASWIPQISGTNQALYAVYFINADTGIAVGRNEIVLRTVNGGAQWTTLTVDTYNSYNDITFTDANTGYIAANVSGGQTLLKTTNGGLTWTPHPAVTTSLKSVCFVNDTLGYAAGWNGTVLKTTNAGIDWAALTTGTTNTINTVYFINDSTGFILTYGSVLKTSNGGTDWTTLITTPYINYYAANFTDTQTGFITGDGGRILKSTDAGNNWTLLNEYVTTNNLESVVFPAYETGYAAGGNGTIIKTTNGGYNWGVLNSGTTQNLHAVWFTDNQTGYVAGAGGTILHTTNAGADWVPKTTNTTIELNTLCFTDALTGYAAGNNGVIIKTLDAGNSWFTQNSTLTFKFNKIFFTGPDTGYAVTGYLGSSGRIVKTTDGGSNWYLLANTGPIGALYSIFFTDANTGYACGKDAYYPDRGMILKTVDGGDNWSQIIPATTTEVLDEVYEIYFTNDSTGYAIDKYGKIIKTTNSGVSWHKQIGGARSVCFVDENTGYAVQNNGGIMKTTTAGDLLDDTIDSLRIAYFEDVSDMSPCFPYDAQLLIKTWVSGLQYHSGDSLYYNIWFGDGSDTLFADTLQHVPMNVLRLVPHAYNFPGIYSVKCKVTTPAGQTDSLTVTDLVIAADTCGNISGNVFVDVNNDCVKNGNEQGFANIKVKLSQNNTIYAITYTDSIGNYSFDVPNNLTYNIVADTNFLYGLTLTCPPNASYIVSQFPTQNNDFALVCNQGFDLDAFMTGSSFRPGMNGQLHLHVKNNSCYPFSGTVAIVLDSLTSILTTSPVPDQSYGDSLIWSFTNLTNQGGVHIPVSLQTSTNAWVGNSVCFRLYVYPNTADNDTTNNEQLYCFPIVNSWDPNFKEVNIPGFISGDTTLTYTIHFQNTGNAEAYNIFILDTLDTNLDLGSFQLLSYSHPMSLNVINQPPNTVLKFNFNDIMLPDSTANNLQSMGYVAYSMRTKTGLADGIAIKNKAYIYFDFNPAIETNTVENTILITDINTASHSINITIYPNPSTGKVFIESDETINLRVFNLIGIEILNQNFVNNKFVTLNHKGVYLFELSTGKARCYKKVVIQ